MTLYAKSACNLSAPVHDFDIAEICSGDEMGSHRVHASFPVRRARTVCKSSLISDRQPNHKAESGGSRTNVAYLDAVGGDEHSEPCPEDEGV
jgi:hypothetical protein